MIIFHSFQQLVGQWTICLLQLSNYCKTQSGYWEKPMNYWRIMILFKLLTLWSNKIQPTLLLWLLGLFFIVAMERGMSSCMKAYTDLDSPSSSPVRTKINEVWNLHLNFRCSLGANCPEVHSASIIPPWNRSKCCTTTILLLKAQQLCWLCWPWLSLIETASCSLLVSLCTSSTAH